MDDEEWTIPEVLPFLASLSWFDLAWRSLAPIDMLRRYESGWRYRDVTATIEGEEQAFVRALVRRYGSHLDV